MVFFINFIVYFFTFFSYLLLCYTNYQLIKKGSSDIFQYKIKSLSFSWFISFLYIFFFIFFLYFLRLMRHGQNLDLKKKIFYPFMDFYYSLDFIFFSYFLLICFIFCFFISLIFFKIHTFCIIHLIKLNLYYNITLRKHDFPEGYYHSFSYLLNHLLASIGDCEIISYTINEIFLKISRVIDKKRGNIYGTPNYKPSELHAYHKYNPIKLHIYLPSQGFQTLIAFSPFVLFIYECFAYNFVISLFFKYLLIYIPLMLFKRITTARLFTSTYICSILWDIFYKKEKNCIYAIPKEAQNLWEYFIRNKLCGLGPKESLRLTNDPCFETNFGFNLYYSSYFIPYNNELNMFTNSEICCKYLEKENLLIREKEEEIFTEDGTFLKIETKIIEEWVIIAKKFHFYFV